MPPTIYVNRTLSEAERRDSIYKGDFHLFVGEKASADLVDWIRELVEDAFGGLDPETAQLQLTVREFIERVGPLKSRFTNNPKTRELCRNLIVAMGCDPDETFFDLPRLRVAPSDGYLTSGVSYAYKAHRDTWYAHPPMLVNYWIPVFDVTGENVMSFWPAYWTKALANSGYDYDEWVKKYRFAASQQTDDENRPHPLPIDPLDMSSEIRIALNAGDVTMFSTCQLHASADNTSGKTRFSYDLRTLNLPDLLAGRGPRDLDSNARGSTLADFLRVSDFQPLQIGPISAV